MSNSYTSRIGKLALLAVCGISFLGFSQTADQLKTRFATFLGPNKFAKLVWQIEGNTGRKPNFDLGGGWQNNPSKIMGMDTRDGIVRTLAPAKSGTHYSGAALTWDGNKVIYTEGVSHKIYVVDFADTSTRRTLLSAYEGDGRCWQSPDGKNWALVTQYLGYNVIGAKLQRVNVVDPTEIVDIFTTTTARVDWRSFGADLIGAGSTCWASMSTDGKYVAGGFPNYDALGVLTVATGNKVTLNPNGCWPSIARDTTGDVLFIDNPGAHKTLRISTRTGALRNTVPLSTAIRANSSTGEVETVRWTPDRDYITVFAYTGGSAFSTQGVSNPRLVRLSDQSFVAITDNPSFPEGNMDVYFYSSSSTDSPLASRVLSVNARANSSNLKIFDLRGRGLSSARVINPGIRISQYEGGVLRSVQIDDLR